MKRKIGRWLAIGGAAALVLLLGLWGFHERQMRQTVTIHAENHYQQAYHELTYYVDSLEETLGMALAMQTREAMRPQLVESWRLSTLAHAAANELPLTLLPFNRTNEFLSHVGDFTYNTGVKTISDRPLRTSDYRTLQKLYHESMTIRDGLRQLQQKVMTNHLRWMDVETALKMRKQNKDNQVIDGLKQVDGQATDYTQSFSPENPRNLAFQKKDYRQLPGKEITKKQAIDALKQWIGVRGGKVTSIYSTGKGANIAAYNMTLRAAKDEAGSYAASVSRKGGHIIWFMNERAIGANRVSLYAAQQKAAEFLQRHHFRHFLLTKREHYSRVAVYTYVPEKDHVRLYPASIKIKIGLDRNDVIGFDQSNYLANRCAVPLKPKLTAAAVQKQLNPKLRVQETNLAIFKNNNLENVLCYEFYATKGDETYRVFLNADNGDQEKMELLRN